MAKKKEVIVMVRTETLLALPSAHTGWSLFVKGPSSYLCGLLETLASCDICDIEPFL